MTENTKSKKMKSWIIFALGVLNIILFIVLTNKLYFRFDLTEKKTYSVDKATKNLLKKLDNKLVINYYYEKRCKEVPGINAVIQYIDDMLKEYQANGNGMVEYNIKELSYSNPKDKEKIDEITQNGVVTVALSQNAETESKSTLGFSGIIMNYKGETNANGQINNLGIILDDMKFEYNMDMEINKLIGKDKTNNVGILAAASDRDLSQGFKNLYQYTKRDFQSAEIIYPGMDIPDSIGVLLIIDGETLSEFDMLNIDQFIMDGGKVVLLANGVKINLNRNQYSQEPPARPSSNKLLDMFAKYGIKVNPDLVGDNESFNYVSQRGQVYSEKFRYPLWIKVIKQNISPEKNILNNMDTINFSWASSITIDDKIKSQTIPLIKTTKSSWSMTNDYKLDLDYYKNPAQEGKNQYVLGCIFEGNVESYFDPANLPKNENQTYKKPFLPKGKTTLLVISNEEFVADDFLRREDELYIILNSLDYMTRDGALNAIRDKGKFTRPLDKVYNTDFEAVKNRIIFVSMIIVPLLLIGFAIFYGYRRENNFKKLQSKFENK